MIASSARDRTLGNYLRDRRSRLDPAALGFPVQRRRTPGLRREEVAQRAHVSPTWYTWLEQGRGGAPSADVLDRIARALMLTSVEREHLFFIALGRPPEVHYQGSEGISPRLQRVLDALEVSPAFVKTVTWDLVSWNRAAAALFGYDQLATDDRNILRKIFTDPRSRAAQLDVEAVMRFVVSAFRADVARAGAGPNVEDLVGELSQRSPEFAALWQQHDVRVHGEGTKKIKHPEVGLLEMEYSAFVVDGRSDLTLVIYNPATPEDGEKIRTLVMKVAEGAKQPAKRRR